jgi:hypothetical protein
LIKKLLTKNFELLFWVAGLLSLALTDPSSNTHFSLCPLRMLGLTWCPGCGLGHAISWLFHGDLRHSLQAHWLGAPALLILFYRILTLAKHNFRPKLTAPR